MTSAEAYELLWGAPSDESIKRAFGMANEVLRRIAEREKRVEGYICNHALGLDEIVFGTKPHILVPSVLNHATLIIGEPYQPKPKLTDAQKIEAALRFVDEHRGAAPDHPDPCQLTASHISRVVARILRGEEEA